VSVCAEHPRQNRENSENANIINVSKPYVHVGLFGVAARFDTIAARFVLAFVGKENAQDSIWRVLI